MFNKQLFLTTALSFVLPFLFIITVEASNFEEYEHYINENNIIIPFYIDKEDYFEQLHFRMGTGLSVDHDVIIENILDDSQVHTKEKYGVTLSKKEEQEMDKRAKIQIEDAPKLRDFIYTNVDEDILGGIWVDQANKGTYVVNVTVKPNEISHIIKESKKIFKNNIDRLRFNWVENTEKELDEINNYINNNLTLETIKDLSIIGSTVDTKENKVEVVVSNLNNDIEKKVLNLFGNSKVYVSEEKIDETENEATRYQAHQLLMGGLAITNERNEGCTIAYSASKPGDGHFIITAGHCSQSNEKFYQASDYIGYTKYRSVSASYGADITAIRVPHDRITDWVHLSNPKDVRMQTRSVFSQFSQGERICKTGRTTGVTCGNVTRRVAPNSEYVQADYYSEGGDSGALVYYGTKIYGIHRGSYYTDHNNNNRMDEGEREGALFSHVEKAHNAIPISTSHIVLDYPY
ncbi:S1 family peptidase [Halalkalibacter urbisdiaboli]|uniref:S1 family peptidase n=1 Tax=Halalkalibacter urbisdiaboli TaxID=1960589 RepID=UPI000B43CEEF|nr:S1 family peptidase [Halalkalibacter urbisdiaboli]